MLKPMLAAIAAMYFMFLATTASWGLDLLNAKQTCENAMLNEFHAGKQFPDIDRVMRQECAPMIAKAEVSRRILDSVVH